MMANESCPLPQHLQEDDAAAKRNADFLSSLPKEKGDIAPYLYNYQGCWTTAFQLQGVLAFQKNFQAKDSDIFVVTAPKCGTTWLKALVFAIINRKLYSVRSPDHPLLVENPHDLVPYIDFIIYAQKENPDLSCLESPRLLATHLPYALLPPSIKDSKCKLVCLCRNPKDTFISLWHFANKVNHPVGSPMDELFERFCSGATHFGPYWDHALGYWEKSLEMSGKVFFFKFEGLKDQPFLSLKKLAEFLGFPFSSEEEASGVPDEILWLCSFDNLSNLQGNKDGKFPNGIEKKVHFRRGEVGDWKNFLTNDMIKRIDDLAEDKFKASGLHF